MSGPSMARLRNGKYPGRLRKQVALTAVMRELGVLLKPHALSSPE